MKTKGTKKTKKKKSVLFVGAIHITKDIWFYPNKKSMDFIVWIERNGERHVTQFRVLHRMLNKYM